MLFSTYRLRTVQILIRVSRSISTTFILSAIWLHQNIGCMQFWSNLRRILLWKSLFDLARCKIIPLGRTSGSRIIVDVVFGIAIRKSSFIRWGATTCFFIVFVRFVRETNSTSRFQKLTPFQYYLSPCSSLFSVMSGKSYWMIARVLVLSRETGGVTWWHLLAWLDYSRSDTVRLRGWRAIAHTRIHHLYFRSGHCLCMVCGLRFVWQWSCHF